MSQENILYICNGCCCGHPEKGNPIVKKELFRELLGQEEFDKQVTMEVPYCLGPCRMANVVKALINGKMYWFRQINSEDDVHAVITFLKNPKEVPAQLQMKQVFF